LRDLLQRAIAGDYTREQLGELHRLAYLIARQYVRMRCTNGRLPLSLFGLGEADVVHDCIADLFTRSGSGELVEISRYFEYRRISPQSVPDDLLLVHLRNLVFTVAGDNVFRMLNEHDSALGKVIRNIKIAVQKSESWSLETRFEERVLVLRRNGKRGTGDGNAGQNAMGEPPLHDEQLEPAVLAALARNSEIPALLDALGRELERSVERVGPVPMISLAVMIKNGYEKVHVAGERSETAESPMLVEELRTMIGDCCRSVDRAMRPKYVGKGKVCEETFRRYIAALESFLTEEYVVHRDITRSSDATYFEYLRTAMPALSRDEYLRDHRPVFEYLGKQVKSCLRGKIAAS
jgi:hypothetical protein